MKDESEKMKVGGKVKDRKLTLLQYVIYLGVTPCALAALALLFFIIFRGPEGSEHENIAVDSVCDTTGL